MHCGYCKNSIEGRIYFSGKTPAHWKCKNILNAQMPKAVADDITEFVVGEAVLWCKSLGRGGVPVEGVVEALDGKFVEITVSKKVNRPARRCRVLASSLTKRTPQSGPLGATFGHLWNNF